MGGEEQKRATRLLDERGVCQQHHSERAEERALNRRKEQKEGGDKQTYKVQGEEEEERNATAPSRTPKKQNGDYSTAR